MRVIPDLSISPEKVFFVISKSRRSDSEAGGDGVVLDFGDDDMSYGRGGRGETPPTVRSSRASSALSMLTSRSISWRWPGSAAATVISRRVALMPDAASASVKEKLQWTS